LCFITSENRGEIASKLARRTINVFVPTSPNPTSGFMLVVPAEDLIPLEMSIEDGMKMVISAGSYIPYETYGQTGQTPREFHGQETR
jgi:uncharacterized membrane protein